MFECFGRKFTHRRERRNDRRAMLRTLCDVRKHDDPTIFTEAWLEYRQEREHWSCPCAMADGVAVASPGSPTSVEK